MSLWTRTENRARAADESHDVKTAYEKGRRDERAERKRHPFVMAGLFVLAAAGASLITLAAMNGSFTGGGEVADHQISVAAPAVQNAVTNAGHAAQAAGAGIADKGKALVTHDKS
jgi:hypothetical protein